MSGWRKWQQWNFAADLLIFAGALVYEWCWDPENWKLYAAFLGALALLAYPLWRLSRLETKSLNGPPSKWYALLLAVGGVVILIARCLESKDGMRVPHVMFLPWYIGLSIQGLVDFFVLWRWEKKCRAEYQKKMATGGSVWKNINMPKGT